MYKKPDVPDIKNPSQFKTKIKVTHAKLNDHWWKNFHDVKLNQLVELAVKNNYSYQVSLKNIQIACTYVMQNVSTLFPQANLSFSSSRNKLASTLSNGFGSTNLVIPNQRASIFNLQQLTGTVSYELDIWNQLRNSIKQAEVNQAGSVADSNVIKLALITNVVDTYLQIKALNANLNNLHNQNKFADEIVKLTNTQFKSGLIDASTLDTVKNQAEIIKSNIYNLEKQQQVLLFTLAYLVGEYPENFAFTIKERLQKLQTAALVPAGIPSEMMANRPDIQSAYYQILSYGYLENETWPIFYLL